MYIYGIGRTTSKKILTQSGISYDTKVRDLTESEITRLREVIDRECKVEGDLRRWLIISILLSLGLGLALEMIFTRFLLIELP